MNRIQGKQYQLRRRTAVSALVQSPGSSVARKEPAFQAKTGSVDQKKSQKMKNKHPQGKTSVAPQNRRSALVPAKSGGDSGKKKKIAKNKARLFPSKKKENWTEEEDKLLLSLVQKYGAKNWTEISTSFSNRLGKQCRERWYNHLSPDVNKSKWTEQEDLILLHAYMEFGSRWSIIAGYLPGRTDNSIKNHYNSTIKRKLKNNELNFTPVSSKIDIGALSLQTAATTSPENNPGTLNVEALALKDFGSDGKGSKTGTFGANRPDHCNSPSVEYQVVLRDERPAPETTPIALKVRLPVINPRFLENADPSALLSDLISQKESKSCPSDPHSVPLSQRQLREGRANFSVDN